MNNYINPEPTPIHNDSVPVWEIVIEDYRKFSTKSIQPEIEEKIVDLMKDRNQFGIDKYGTPLQTNNGRNSLIDALQEILDSCVYLAQAIHEDKDDKYNTLQDIYKSQLMNLELLILVMDKSETIVT